MARGSIQIKSTGYADTYRIYRESKPWADGTTLFIAKRAATGGWEAYRGNGVKLAKSKFASPGKVLEWARQNEI